VLKNEWNSDWNELEEDKDGNYIEFDEIKKAILNLKRYDPSRFCTHIVTSLIDYFHFMHENNTGDYIKFGDIMKLFS